MREAKFAMSAFLGLAAATSPRYEWSQIYFKPIEPWKSRRKGGKGRRAS